MKIFWRAVTLMPKSVGHKIIRKNFKFTYDLPQDLVFKIAETTDEIEQAFRVIHDGFVQSKLMDETESRLRITKYYCLPTTTLMVCKHKEEVIATISIIGDSGFGLPTEEFRDLSEYREKGLRMGEISGLAIKKNNQAKRGKLLLALFKYMFQYAHDYMRADALVISTTAEVKEFYRALFFFRPLDNAKVVKFSTVKNRETVSQMIFVKEMPEIFRRTYGHLPHEKNLYHFFQKHEFKQFKIPVRRYPFTIHPVFTAEQMKHFFLDKTTVLEKLEEKEKILLSQSYPHGEFRRIILKNLEPKVALRTSVRTPVSCPAYFGSYAVEVLNVSDTGLKVFDTEKRFGQEDIVELTVRLFEEESIRVRAKVMWSKNKMAGLKLIEVTNEWVDMIGHAHQLYLGSNLREVA